MDDKSFWSILLCLSKVVLLQCKCCQLYTELMVDAMIIISNIKEPGLHGIFKWPSVPSAEPWIIAVTCCRTNKWQADYLLCTGSTTVNISYQNSLTGWWYHYTKPWVMRDKETVLQYLSSKSSVYRLSLSSLSIRNLKISITKSFPKLMPKTCSSTVSSWLLCDNSQSSLFLFHYVSWESVKSDVASTVHKSESGDDPHPQNFNWNMAECSLFPSLSALKYNVDVDDSWNQHLTSLCSDSGIKHLNKEKIPPP